MPETLDSQYAIIKTGGKQYRVAPGDVLLVERLSDDEGATVTLQTLLVAGGDSDASFGKDHDVSVTATVVGHERGEKIRVFKFKPKRGYKKTQGHRQELTRLRVDKIG